MGDRLECGLGRVDRDWVEWYNSLRLVGGDSMIMVDDHIVLCPECGGKMYKVGKVWSGRKRVQRYQCPACGRKAVARSKQEDNSVRE